MKVFAFIVIIICPFIACSHKLYNGNNQKSVVELINTEHQKKEGIQKGSSFYSYDNLIYGIREKAVQLYGIETDTSKINKFIVMDVVSFEGGKSTYGEMVLNDTAKYFYINQFLSKDVEKINYSTLTPKTEIIILKYLNEHRFNELEALAKEKGKSLSGSHFIYLGMYEKGMDSVYVKTLPGFIIN